MKLNTSITLLLITSTIFSQSFSEITVDIVCDCFEKAPKTEALNFDLFKTCFDFSDKKYQALLEEEIKKRIDTLDTNSNDDQGYKKGYEFGRDLFNNTQGPLINNCDAYYHFIEKSKKEMIANISKGIDKKKVDSLQRLLKKEHWDPNDIWQLGAYYLYKGKLKKAKKNFNKCLSKDSKHAPSLFFLAIVHELQGDYTSAIMRYHTINELPQNQLTLMANIYIESAKRKKRKSN